MTSARDRLILSRALKYRHGCARGKTRCRSAPEIDSERVNISGRGGQQPLK
jgi:hypothetical protein